MSAVLDRLRAALADRYTIERELGRGGMAVVYLAQDLRHERQVAIKVLRPELTSFVAAERFLREIKLTAGLAHPHILPLLESGETDGLLYYVMPYVEGESLREKLDREGQLPVDEAARIAREVADALSYAHEHHLLHRDIKPENILLEARHAVVADFGIAKALSEAAGDRLTDTGVSIGTPAYMSPEQAAGERELSPVSDLYSLGCVLYEMLTGEPPIRDRSVQKVVSRKMLGDFRPVREGRGEVPPDMDAAVSRALATEPAERFATASEFSEALEPVSKPGDRRIRLARVIGLYAATSIAALAAAYFLMLQLGLPDWFFSGAAFVLLVCLPIIVATAVVQGGGGPAEAAAAEHTGPTTGWRRWLTWRNAIGAAVALFALLGVAVAGYAGMRAMGIGPVGSLVAAGVLEERERVVLADFDNHTGDSALAIAVTEAFRTDLEQSPTVTLLTPAQVNRVLGRMLVEPTVNVDADLAREIAIREGLKAVIAGEVNSAGSGFLLSVRLVRAEDGESIAAYREAAADSSEIVPAIDRLSARLRERMGESLRSIRANEPLNQVTTSSLEALKRDSRARRLAWVLLDYDAAFPLWEEAVALDSTFAGAYRGLGVICENRRQRACAVRNMTRAYELRERLSEGERLATIALYHIMVTGDLDKALAAQRARVEESDSTRGLNNLGWLYDEIGALEEAERIHRRNLLENDSEHALAFWNLTNLLLNQGKTEDARTTIELWRQKQPQNWIPIRRGADLEAVRGDFDASEDSVLAYIDFVAKRNLGPTAQANARSFSSYWLACYRTLRGRLIEAKRLYRDAMAASAELDNSREVLDRAILLGLLELWFLGDSASGIGAVEEALDEHPLADMDPLNRPYFDLALFYALAGRPDESGRLLSEYEGEIDPGLRAEYRERIALTRMRALTMLASGRVEAAIDTLRAQADRYQAVQFKRPVLVSLGRAFDLQGESHSAIVYYERFVTTPYTDRMYPLRYGPEIGDPFWLPLIYERLGALYAQRGEPTKAIRYYGKLLDLWKDADPEVQPRVEAARRAIEALSTDR